MSDIVRDYYNDNVQKEWERLTLPLGAIEFANTLQVAGPLSGDQAATKKIIEELQS